MNILSIALIIPSGFMFAKSLKYMFIEKKISQRDRYEKGTRNAMYGSILLFIAMCINRNFITAVIIGILGTLYSLYCFKQYRRT